MVIWFGLSLSHCDPHSQPRSDFVLVNIAKKGVVCSLFRSSSWCEVNVHSQLCEDTLLAPTISERGMWTNPRLRSANGHASSTNPLWSFVCELFAVSWFDLVVEMPPFPHAGLRVSIRW